MFLTLIPVPYINNNFVVESNKVKADDKKGKIVLIDPGHGGMDGGAQSKSGILEKNINLKISLKLKDRLQKEGYKIIMTREEDKGLYEDSGSIRKKKVEDLNNRCKIKETSKCDMFISVHLNMFPQSKYYGAQVWYSKNQESEKLAKIIQEGFEKDLDSTNKRKPKPALNSYKVLRESGNIPAVIVECGFLSNPVEADKLNTDEYQEKITESLTNSVKNYYNE